MAKILVYATDNFHEDPETERVGSYKKGYPVAIHEDDHVYGGLEKPPTFVVLSCPTITTEQANAYNDSWNQTIDYNVLSADPVTGTYQIEVFGDNISISGEAILTREQVEPYLNNWGATVDSASQNNIVFTLRLWQTLQSHGFWNENILLIDFTLNSYANDVANVTASNIPEDRIEHAKHMVERKGGTIVSFDLTSITFTITRQSVLSAFQADIKQKAERAYCRRQYYFSSAIVDQALLEPNGVLELTTSQLLAALNNKLEE